LLAAIVRRRAALQPLHGFLRDGSRRRRTLACLVVLLRHHFSWCGAADCGEVPILCELVALVMPPTGKANPYGMPVSNFSVLQ
jgi:hypothetical protein